MNHSESLKKNKDFQTVYRTGISYANRKLVMYVIENGKATHAGIGYSEDDHSISLWDVDSTIDFDLADTQEFWEFLETYE